MGRRTLRKRVFPTALRLDGVQLPLAYRFEPGHRAGWRHAYGAVAAAQQARSRAIRLSRAWIDSRESDLVSQGAAQADTPANWCQYRIS